MMVLHCPLALVVGASVVSATTCDIFAAGDTPCAAAHSTTRALFKDYGGPLYAVKRADGKILDIRATVAGGYADSASQDKFCAGSTCVFWTIYDQSPKGNHLGVAKSGGRAAVPARPAMPAWAPQEKMDCAGQDMTWPGCSRHQLHGCMLNTSATIAVCEAKCKATPGCVGTVFAAANCSGEAHPSPPICWLKSSCRPHPSRSGACRTVSLAKAFPAVPARPAVPGRFDRPTDATADPLTVGGHKVYGIRMDPPSGYRRDNTTGIAINDEPETIYAVFNGSHYNDRCCFDYGNAETNNHNDGAGTMEAIYFGSAQGPLNHAGAGKGPWIMADLESGLWGADKVDSEEEPIEHMYVTAMVKGDAGPAPGHWAIKGGNAQAGVLKSYWDGHRAPRYAPMKKQGAIILGIGGDNSNGAVGTFYEGVMVQGYSSNSTDAAVQANIVAAGYGK